MKQSYKFSNKVITILFSMFFLVITGGCGLIPEGVVSGILGQGSNNPPVALQQPQMTQPVNVDTEDEEKTVVLNIGNYGRKNPFKPYIERSLITDTSSVPKLSIPEPPMLMPDNSVQELLEIKVAGILYSPPNSTAILNIKEKDYLVHKNDNIFSFRVKNITKTGVTLCAGNNEYKAAIGEIIEGEIIPDPASKLGGGYRPVNINSSMQSPGGMSLPAPPDLLR